MEHQPSSGERDTFGPLSTLSDVTQVCEAITGVFSDLFADHNVENEDGARAVFTIGADIERLLTEDDETGETFMPREPGFVLQPHGRWEAEAGLDAVIALARTLLDSRDRPDTQITGPSSLEILVRDETAHNVLTVPAGTTRRYDVTAGAGVCTVTVGPPSVALLLRLALRRTGFERLAVFDRSRMFDHLAEQNRMRKSAEGTAARISAQRLLKVMAEPKLLSLRLEGGHTTDLTELERVATAFRVRLAYESDVVLAPVLDVHRLDSSPSQPRLIRQLTMRSTEFIQAIGEGRDTGRLGDQLLGTASVVNEELALRYLRAIAAVDPFAAFMGYYHVLEFGMEEEWFEGLRKRVTAAGGVLNRPADGLDTRRGKNAVAKQSAQALGVGQDTVDFREQRALEAVLDTHLDVLLLGTDLGRHLEGAIDYFATGTLPFAVVPHLDFTGTYDDTRSALLRRRTAERIYRVRCAIAHSKESGERYSPYTDDLHLGREVPLVRLAAEQLLIPPDERL
ncbi:hypothetical protein ACFYOA_27910 [Streptomyces iakyrus]|uniref:hypothetical protein n=1 Tax=Streptomyces iakyrus TaxID=68219 RepID=UPI0036840B72